LPDFFFLEHQPVIYNTYFVEGKNQTMPPFQAIGKSLRHQQKQ